MSRQIEWCYKTVASPFAADSYLVACTTKSNSAAEDLSLKSRILNPGLILKALEEWEPAKIKRNT